jgi:DNA modification methylase
MSKEVIYRKLSELKKLPNNPRTIKKDDMERLKKSIKDNPDYFEARPIILSNRTGDLVILAGNQRYEAAKALGMDEVPTFLLEGLTEAREREIIIRDNVSNGDWDMDALANEWDTQELTDWGVDINWDEPDQEVVEDEAPEVNESEPADSVLGGVYQLGRHRLMCGDSTDAGSVAILMDGQKADMVFTDPPYGISIVGDNGKVGAGNLAKNRVYSKVIADDTTETAEKAYKILKNYSNKLVIWGGNYFVDFLDFSDGWIIWDKRGDMNSNNFADGEMAWCSFHTPVRIYKQLWNGMIREGEHENRVHPTQKPIKMLGDILKDFTKSNESILDVFGGSGSTLIACEQLGRKCYMMELDPHYCDVIRKRYWKFVTGSEEGWQDGTKAN